MAGKWLTTELETAVIVRAHDSHVDALCADSVRALIAECGAQVLIGTGEAASLNTLLNWVVGHEMNALVLHGDTAITPEDYSTLESVSSRYPRVLLSPAGADSEMGVDYYPHEDGRVITDRAPCLIPHQALADYVARLSPVKDRYGFEIVPMAQEGVHPRHPTKWMSAGEWLTTELGGCELLARSATRAIRVPTGVDPIRATWDAEKAKE